MEMDSKQEQKLTNIIHENWELCLSTLGKIDGMISEYLKENLPPSEQNMKVGGKSDRPVSDDKITNLMNRLGDTNLFIREKLWGQLDNMSKRLSRL